MRSLAAGLSFAAAVVLTGCQEKIDRASCDGLERSVWVIFREGRKPKALMRADGRDYTLRQAASGSGARYLSEEKDGIAQLWVKGNTARLELPGRAPTSCRFDKRG
jgi:membrane-bound inhibitor of C-type lysozyme